MKSTTTINDSEIGSLDDSEWLMMTIKKLWMTLRPFGDERVHILAPLCLGLVNKFSNIFLFITTFKYSWIFLISTLFLMIWNYIISKSGLPFIWIFCILSLYPNDHTGLIEDKTLPVKLYYPNKKRRIHMLTYTVQNWIHFTIL